MNPDNGLTGVDSAVRLCYAPASLRQLLVVTTGCRLLKLDAYTGQLLSEVGSCSGRCRHFVSKQNYLQVILFQQGLPLPLYEFSRQQSPVIC